MCAAPIDVRAQHDLVERIAGRDAHLDPLERTRAGIDVHPRARTRARRRQHARVEQRRVVGERRAVDTGRVERAFHEHGVLGETAARNSVPTGGPTTSTSRQRAATTHEYGDGHCTSNAAAPPVATTPSISTRPSRHTAVAAIGGRLGPSRTTSSRE